MTRTIPLRLLGPDPGRPPWLARRSRLTRLLPYVVAAYGLIVAVTGAAQVNGAGRMIGGLFFLLVLVPVAGLVLAVRRPLDGWRVVTLFWLLVPFVVPGGRGGDPLLAPWQWLLWIPVLVAVAWAVPRRTLVVVAALSVALVVVLAFLTPERLGSLLVSVVGVLGALLVGASLGARWDARRALVVEQARTAEAQAERGALAERARIAREMHDVVGHELSTIAVRCETAPYRLGPLPPDAAAELAAVAGTARDALTGLQRLLGVLRADAVPLALALGAPPAGHGLGVTTVLTAWWVPWQLGVAMARRPLSRGTALLLLAAGVTGLVLLLTVGGLPPTAVGLPGAARSNLDPPSAATVCLALAQAGLAAAALPALRRHSGARRLRAAAGAGRSALRVFLVHQPLFVLLWLATPPAGPVPGLHDAPAGPGWLLSRAFWLLPLAAVLTGVARAHFPRPGTPIS